MNADVMFDSFNTILVSIYNYLFPNDARKTKSQDILKRYINADLRELFQDKHRVEKNSNARPLHTETNIEFYEI